MVVLTGSLLPHGVFAADANPPTPVAQSASAPTDNKFDILEFRVLGNHTLPPTAIEQAVYPFLGPQRDIDTVKKAAQALEKAYKDAGYGAIYVDIPEQTVDEGIVRLQVTEGRIDRVRIRGERYFSGRQIRAAVPALVKGETPQLPTVQAQIAEVNARTTDWVVTPILTPGRDPGTVDVDLNVKDTLPLHGSVEVDDRHTADTTPNRASASLSYDNLWQRQDSISLQYQTAPARTANATVESASYTGHVGGNGGLASFSYIHTSSNVLALGTLGVLGRGSIFGLHWMQPIVNNETATRTFTVGIDYKDVNTIVFPDATNSNGTPVTAPVHYLNWSGTYSQAWRFPSTSVATSLGIGLGLTGVVNQVDEFENARAGATPAYFYLRLSGQLVQSLPFHLSGLARFSSQWSANPLVNNEQFSLGGADTVRGYLEAETLGETGIAGTLEVHSPPIGKLFGSILSPLYGYGFIDAGVATLLDPLQGQDYHVHLWSTGVGMRLDTATGLGGAVDFAIPEENGLRTRRHGMRILFNVHYGF